MNWDQLADKQTIDKIINVLKVNGIDAKFVETGSEAFDEVFKIIPNGAEVMTMSSVTLDSLGISKEVQESGKYDSVKNKLGAMNRETQGKEMRQLGATPDWTIGSVHAVTEDGHLLIASNTASQLPAYVYGAEHVIWVVGVQKITKNIDAAMKRIYEYVLPLESARLNELFNMTSGSFVSKILIVNRELNPNRSTVIFVGEKIGF